MHRAPGIHRQQAMALVAMLIVLALMTVAVVKSAASHQLAGRLVSNGQDSDLARLALQQLEATAAGRLLDPAAGGQAEQLTAGPAIMVIDQTAVPGGFSRAWIEDLQGRINLNNLAPAAANPDQPPAASATEPTADAAPQPAGPPRTIDQLKILLRNADINSLFIDRIHDWVDGDSQQRYPDGAEDDYYLRLRPAYRAANQPLTDIDELLLLKGMRPELYQTLLPWLTALPEPTTINLNSAPAAVLMTLHPDITPAIADQLVELRQRQPYRSVAQFLRQDQLAGLPVSAEGLATQSRYFCLHSTIQIGTQEFHIDTLLSKTADNITRLFRRYGI